MNMETLYSNYLNTTTMVVVSTGTSTASRLFDRGSAVYQSSGDNSDLTTTTITINFSTPQEIDRIILQDHNFKSFKIYYNSNSANLFSLTSAETGTSEWSTNSETSQYLLVNEVTCSRIIIEATATMIANANKQIAQLWTTKQIYQFVDNPASKDFKPALDRKEYSHEMSDGGYIVVVLQDNYKCDIKRNFVRPEEYDDLVSLRNLHEPFVFTAEPTGTSWNSKIYEVNWIGDFNFEQFADNYKGNGYRGSMMLRETPR